MVREGISFNLLEYACWEDQILTVIIFDQFQRENNTISHRGVILMSVYRRQNAKAEVFYKELKLKIRKIRDRY